MRIPTVGLMTTDVPQTAKRAVFDHTWLLLAEAALAQGARVLFFNPHDIPASRGRVKGVVWTNGGWETVREPIPRVIVDNVFVHISRTSSIYANNKRMLKKAGYLFINPRIPDKWGVWSALLKVPQIRPNLPETALLERNTDMDGWLKKHPTVFLKPTRGSGGNGILRVERALSNYKVTRGDQSETLTPQKWRRLIDSLTEPDKKKYLVQQGLSLLEFEDRKVDIRVLLHRDADLIWQPVASVPRLGDTGQIVTNLHQGGETKTLDWLAEQTRGLGIELPPRAAIENVAVGAAEAMTKIRPRLAFLGIDIAPDDQGRLWLLDLNPRPGRKVLSDEDKKFAFRCLIGFAKRMLQGRG